MNKRTEIISNNELIGGKCITLCHGFNYDLIKVINSENVTSILLSEANGWNDKDIDFLVDIPNLKGIQIYSNKISNLDAINNLKNLELIGLQTNSKIHPDFKIFPRLKNLLVSWKPGTESCLGHASLEYMNVDKYPYQNLRQLSDNRSIKRLSIMSSKLESLDWVSSLPKLSKIDLSYCSKLSDITDLANCEALQELGFLSCKKIGEFPMMGKARLLKKLMIENCGSFDSLNPFKDCTSLEEVFAIGETKIQDGDFNGILNIPSLRIFHAANKRHYSHTREEIKAILSKR